MIHADRPAKAQRLLIAYAHKEGRVFICRLFQRSYYDEYSSLENTIQWTFLLFVWLPALFPLHLLY